MIVTSAELAIFSNALNALACSANLSRHERDAIEQLKHKLLVYTEERQAMKRLKDKLLRYVPSR
jgi:hypothetical protein